MTKSLDLGCGNAPRNPFSADQVFGIDVNSQLQGVINLDLVINSIPFKDDFFDYVTAYDFIEHIPRVVYFGGSRLNPFVEIMNEIWRVLRPGGIFLSFTPAFPKSAAFSDPTHVNIITEDTMLHYFDERWLKARIYGFRGAFVVEEQIWVENHLLSRLRKSSCHEEAGDSILPVI